MLLLHDLAVARLGDIPTPLKKRSDDEEEKKRFGYYQYLCSVPRIYGLGRDKSTIVDDFLNTGSINAKIAYEIDRIEAVKHTSLTIQNRAGIHAPNMENVSLLFIPMHFRRQPRRSASW